MTDSETPFEEAKRESHQPLPEELDNERVIFSYGSLLEHEQLRELLRTRGQFEIFETRSAEVAARLARRNPNDIVILKNVCLRGVRAAIVTEAILRRWFRKRGGELEKTSVGVTAREIPENLFLYARAAETHEKGRTLNGGLICNLTDAELKLLDKYEFEPVLKRSRAPQLRIGNREVFPEHITFYAGTENFDDITRKEKRERGRLLDLNRKPGAQSPQARWRSDVRRFKKT